jgi:chemotaxis protein CheX
MDDQDINVFISTARRYFASLEERPSLVIEPPFVREKLGPFLEYTGIIGVSGRTRGVVCFTATGKMLGEILALLKETRTDEEAKKDLVGEIANTLSGNAREEFGSDFQISVPTVVVGRETHLSQRNDSRNYAIPLNWHAETAYLLVALE